MRLYSDKDFYVREATKDDVSLYAKMLRDEDWLKDSGFLPDQFSEDKKIEDFINKKHPDDIKWLVFHKEKGVIGFLHINVDCDKYANTIGGVYPQYLNSGLGLKYFAKCIDLYFKTGNKRILHSNVYQGNLRSCKMHFGFRDELVNIKIIHGVKYDVYETNRDTFYNAPLVKRILEI